jgi:hypothetical protein
VGRERTSFRVMLLCCVTNFVRTLPAAVGRTDRFAIF